MTLGTVARISILLPLYILIYAVIAEPYVEGDRRIFPADATNVELHTYTGDSGVPDTYIVKLKQGVDPQTTSTFVENLKSEPYSVTNGRSSAFENDPSVGVMMDFGDTKMVVVETQEEGLRLLRGRVDVVEAIYQDSIVTTAQAPVCYVPCECPAAEEPVDNNVCPPKTAATDWGLDRINQPNGQLDGKFNVMGTGSDVNVYIFDSGIYAEHQEFSNSDGSTRVSEGFKALDSWNFTDIYGHGTHVAGIIGGKTVGVAKNVNLINVKILNDAGSGQVSWAIWAMYEAAFPILASGQKSIMVLALQSSRNDAFNDVIQTFTNYGVTIITGSGNNNGLSFYQSPGSSEAAITVGASAAGDTKAIYSNYGPEVDIWAPGTDILSSATGSPDAYDQGSGTSVAAAFVAGAAAAYMSSLDYRPAPAEVAAYLIQQATDNVITDSPTQHNCRWEATCYGAHFWSCRIQWVCDSISTTTRFLHVGCNSDATVKK
ncbi:uncharacterized protein LOC106163942 [Lingula anatina]|uniref:Uncharacterized protein LOC106163942 n=1 Tax=Lingula anatina TaxID=7574 RepID=A0A1S3IFX4_LINAN|nr:uncharacterized protein LOC106163942 [Lingula anatina]|eukprot:XP_013397117.1 uncharacterized protein LOC106163942 [Lingula anatina]